MSGTTLLSIITETVTCSDGSIEIVNTVQNAGESVSDFQDRHIAAVAAKKAECSGTATSSPATYTTPVQCSGQEPVDIETAQGASQSWEDFMAAHAQAVRDAIGECS